jgi:hypothetical protein
MHTRYCSSSRRSLITPDAAMLFGCFVGLLRVARKGLVMKEEVTRGQQSCQRRNSRLPIASRHHKRPQPQQHRSSLLIPLRVSSHVAHIPLRQLTRMNKTLVKAIQAFLAFGAAVNCNHLSDARHRACAATPATTSRPKLHLADGCFMQQMRA